MKHSSQCLRTQYVDKFDIESAILLAHCAELAYAEEREEIADWAASAGLGPSSVFDYGNIQGFSTCNEGLAVLCFRGTSNLGQWIRDARVLPVSSAWGKVHAGFKSGLEQVGEIISRFEKVARTCKWVWLTGHSLGGALAVLASARLKQNSIESVTYTFGQPRVGLVEFQARFDRELPNRLWRIVNQSDIVSRIPPGLLYRHCGSVKRITRPGELESTVAEGIEPSFENSDLPPLSEEEFRELMNHLEAHPNSFPDPNSQLEGRSKMFGDHSMYEYIRLLIEIRNGS